jgi:hypothetical protein
LADLQRWTTVYPKKYPEIVYPLCDTKQHHNVGPCHAYRLEPPRARSRDPAGDGWVSPDVRTVLVDDEFQKGGNRMLVLSTS